MNNFNFNPVNGLLDKDVYPTTPASEDEARGQIQAPLNQIKDFINDNIVSFITNGGTINGGLNFGNSSKTQNGYLELNNGFILNWGIVSIASGTQATVSFTKPFPNNALIPITQGGYTNSADYGLYTSSLTKTNMMISKRNLNGTGTSSDVIYWLVLGY